MSRIPTDEEHRREGKALSDLIPGDWVEFEIGFNRAVVYVVSNDTINQKLTFCSTKWLVSGAWTWDYPRILAETPLYLGRTKRRWWIFWNSELIVPFKRLRKHQSLPIKDALSGVADEWPEYVTGSWL